METRRARPEEAEAACAVLRRSITELCHADHRGDAETISLWLANKTPENVRRWIERAVVLVAVEDGALLGVASLWLGGEIGLNYVAPEERFRGVSKSLLAGLEAEARALGLERLTLNGTATARRFYRACGYAETGPPVPGFGITKGYPMAKRMAG